MSIERINLTKDRIKTDQISFLTERKFHILYSTRKCLYDWDSCNFLCGVGHKNNYVLWYILYSMNTNKPYMIRVRVQLYAYCTI